MSTPIDPEPVQTGLTPEAEASLLAAMHSTPATHPDKQEIDAFVLKRTPLDLRPCRDT